jgi:hypothetical protein
MRLVGTVRRNAVMVSSSSPGALESSSLYEKAMPGAELGGNARSRQLRFMAAHGAAAGRPPGCEDSTVPMISTDRPVGSDAGTVVNRRRARTEMLQLLAPSDDHLLPTT